VGVKLIAFQKDVLRRLSNAEYSNAHRTAFPALPKAAIFSSTTA
jgi:hypothetical protein